MDVEMFRMIERIIISLGGILSVYLGYKLFYIATVKTDSGGSFKSALFSASFTKVGPGVFFALFGAYVMATSITTQIDIKTEPAGQAVLRQNANIPAAVLSQMATTTSTLPDSVEKTQLMGLIRQAQQSVIAPAPPGGTIPGKRAVRID